MSRLRLDPIEIEGIVEDSEGDVRAHRTESGGYQLDPIAIEGIVGPKAEPELVAQGVEKDPALVDRVMGWLDSGNGTYMGGFSPEAAASGVADVITLSHTDEIRGALRSGAVSGPEYEAARDRARREIARHQRGHEGSTALGAVGGVAATLPLMAVGIPTGASTMARIGQAIGEGVGMGALSGMGHSEADFGTAEFAGDITRAGAAGGAMSGAIGGAVEGVRSLGSRVASFAEDAARQRMRQAGAENLPEMRRLESRGGATAVAEDLREAGVFGPGGLRSIDSANEAVAAMADDAQRALEGLRPPPDAPIAVEPIREGLEAAFRRLGGGGPSRGLREELRRWITELSESAPGGTLPFEEINNQRQALGRALDEAKANRSSRQGMLREFYGLLAEAQAQAASGGDPARLAAWRQANRRVELGIALGDASQRAAQRAAARSPISGLDYAAGTLGLGGAATVADTAMTGGLGAVGAVLASRAVQDPRTRAMVGEGLAAVGRRAPSMDAQPAIDAVRRATTQGGVRAMNEGPEAPAPGDDAELRAMFDMGDDADAELPPELLELFEEPDTETEDLPPELEALFQETP